MPSYPVINLKTKEKQTLFMTMQKYGEWREENPDWDKDWMEGVGGGGVECVGEWKTRLANNDSGWKAVLDKVGKACPKNASELY